MEIDAWMPREIQAISPLVDRVMLLIEGSQCVQEAKFDVELALREALGNAVVHGNEEDSKTKRTHALPLRTRQRSINRRDGSGKRIRLRKDGE
jgi:anti-sigma regulatory factor (Ser/Thr protein kinase)